MRLSRALVVVLAIVAWPIGAAAAPATRLVYSRETGAEQCADEATLRSAVAARLGYDPFFPWAKTTLTANVRRESGIYHAHIALIDADGIVRGTRDLADAHADCAELLSAMALGISIALDMLDPRPPEVPPEPPEPKPIERPVEPKVPVEPDTAPSQPAPPPPPPALSIDAGLDALTSVGLLPAPATGVDGFARLRVGGWSLAIEGFYDAPSSKIDRFGTGARAFAAGGTLVPCAHVARMAVCALGSVGALRATAADTATATVASVGVRVATELPVTERVTARLHADGIVPLARTTLRVNDEDFWTAPAAGARFGLGFVVRFR